MLDLVQLLQQSGFFSDADLADEARYDLITPATWRKIGALGYDVGKLKSIVWRFTSKPEALKSYLQQTDIRKSISKPTSKTILAKIKSWLPTAIGILAAHKYFSLPEDATNADIEAIATKASPALLEAATRVNTGLWEKVADAYVKPALQDGVKEATREAIKSGIDAEVVRLVSP
jgi:hypothetical protein